MARRIYDYAVKAKLDRLAEMGINLRMTKSQKMINSIDKSVEKFAKVVGR